MLKTITISNTYISNYEHSFAATPGVKNKLESIQLCLRPSSIKSLFFETLVFLQKKRVLTLHVHFLTDDLTMFVVCLQTRFYLPKK